MKTFLEWVSKINESTELKQEMKDYLKNKFKGLEDVNSNDFNFDMEAAIYWFTTDYHSGQFSDMYSVSSTSEYRPGRMVNNIGQEPENVQLLYQALEERYK
jgi:hypothetical protein